jgi:hypothetical protein
MEPNVRPVLRVAAPSRYPFVLACIACAAASAAPDVDALIGRLSRPSPATIAFAEVRFSSLLREPLIVSGELRYASPTSFEREVVSPYRESTTIRGDSVLVEREGERARSFGLGRTPELRGLVIGLGALLAGDAAALRGAFDVQTSGDDESWTLELTPVDPRDARRLLRLLVTGSGGEPRCFAVFDTRGGASVMTLGALADAIPTEPTLEKLLDDCGGE